MKKLILAVSVLSVVALFASQVQAIPETISHQGYLTDDKGVPIDGSVNMVFSLYDVSTGGTPLWSETMPTVQVTKGVYTVRLGYPTPFNLPFDRYYFLGITVEGDAEMIPRTRLRSAPYAIRAATAENVVTTSPIVSTAPTGTAPLQVDSTTMVPNLNAEMLGGKKLGDLDTRYAVVTPPSLMATQNISTVIETSSVYNPSVTIGSDGNPVISYGSYGGVTGWEGLKVLKCGNTACTAGNTITTVDADPVTYTSMTIGTDGMPVILYSYENAAGLKVAKCGNASCTSGNSITTIVGSVSGHFNSIAIGADGLPVISYYDTVLDKLQVFKCEDASCSIGHSSQIDSLETGMYPTIAIGTDGNPVITHQPSSIGKGGAKVTMCGSPDCTAGNITTDAGIGPYTSMVIGVDGNPVASFLSTISYGGSDIEALSIFKCGNSACTNGNTVEIINRGSGYEVAKKGMTSITIDMYGNSIVSYVDGSTRPSYALKVARCDNSLNCVTSNPLALIDDVGSGDYSEWNTALTIGVDGNPVIVYGITGGSDSGLHVFKCANPYCTNNWRRR